MFYSALSTEESCGVWGYVLATTVAAFVTREKSTNRNRKLRTALYLMLIYDELASGRSFKKECSFGKRIDGLSSVSSKSTVVYYVLTRETESGSPFL